MTAGVQYIRQRPTLVPILLALLMIGLALLTGLKSGVATSTGHLDINMTGLTAAISSEVDGLKHDPYRGYRAVRETLLDHGLKPRPPDFPANFRDYKTIAAAFRAGQDADVCGSPLISQTYNDQGLIEFIHGAFWLFGIHPQSMYYFYFLFFLLSVSVYLSVFWRSYAACVLLFACTFAAYSFMPSILFNNEQLISVSNPRFLSIIGIVPLLHILLTFVTGRSSMMNWKTLLALLFQCAMVSFAVAIRDSALWMEISLVLAVVLYAAFYLLPALWRRDWSTLQSFLFSRGAVAIYVVAMLSVSATARSRLELPDCGAGLGAHTFWHNILAGFAYNPDWPVVAKADFGFDESVKGDSISYNAAKEYAEQHHLGLPTEPTIWVATPLSRALGVDPNPFGSWKVYEDVVRRIVFDFARKHPKFVIETFLYYKPLGLLRQLLHFSTIVFKELHFIKLVALVLMIVLIGNLAPQTELAGSLGAGSPYRRRALLVVIGAVGPLLLATLAYRVLSASEWLFLVLLLPLLIAGGVGALAPPGSSSKVKENAEPITFQHIATILAFCLAISAAPLIVAYPDDYLVADQAYLAVAGILFSVIWLFTEERSVLHRSSPQDEKR